MKAKLALLFIAASAFVLVTPNIAKAQDTVDAFNQYSDPHSICDFYRSSQADIVTATGTARPVIERESDSECLISIGSGTYKSFTQYYYSGNDWCYKLYSGSEVVSSLCVPRPNNLMDSIDVDPEVLVVIIIFTLFVSVSIIGSRKPPVNPAQPTTESVPTYSPPQSVRSKVRRTKKRGRIWTETSRWPKSGRK